VSETKPMNVHQRLLMASSLIGCVGKNGENTHFKFKYQAWDDVLPAVRAACVDSVLTVTESVDLVRHEGGVVIVKLTMTITAAEQGDAISLDWYGEAKGTDDKGIQKAITSATKYAYLKTFMIPCSEDADPDGAKPARETKPEAAKKQNAADQKAAAQISDTAQKVKDLGVVEAELTPIVKSYKTAGKSWLETAKIVLESCDGDKDLFLARMHDHLVAIQQEAA